MSEYVVVAGLSGAGRSTAAGDLEDLGWFVIDNVPAALIPKLGELAGSRSAPYARIGLVVRAGGPDGVEDVRPVIEGLSEVASRLRILFLDASTDVLVRRYESSKRPHPMADEGVSVAEAIELERAQLQPLREIADLVIDTSELNVHQLKARITDLFADEDAPGMRVNLVSFGYKHGLPLDVDVVLDCRFLPNPHWVDELRPLTGLDAPVREHVLGQEQAVSFLERLGQLLDLLLPAYAADGRTYLTVALGCTGGRHRSVVIAEAIAELVRERGYDPAVSHRDLER